MSAIRLDSAVSSLLYLLIAMTASRAPLRAAATLEAETFTAPHAEVFRDDRASGGKATGVIFGGGTSLLTAQTNLPAGDYVATFWMEAVPAEILHHLAVTLSAGSSSLTLGQIHFDSKPGYQPFQMAFFHPGGTAIIQLKAAGGVGFDGMRTGISEQEQRGIDKAQTGLDEMLKKAGGTDEEALDLLEDERNVKQLSPLDHRLLCDRIEIKTVRAAPAMVTGADVDKIHYLPGETVKAEAIVQGGTESGEYRFMAEDITELDSAREVFSKPVTLGKEKQTVAFEYELNGREFGHELRCSLVKGSATVHSRSRYFGVSHNVYRIGITGSGMGQNMQRVTEKDAAEAMLANKRAYANYFERFAWAPCDYSDLAPGAELFWSGQTQYPGSITGFKHLLREAHKVGVKGITYGKACAGGIAGFRTYQRHPEFFWHCQEGPSCEAMSVFYLERMVANDYSLQSPAEGGWQHWASLWCDGSDATVEFGAKAVMDSIDMFGWDGIRWDGHFVGHQQPFLKLLKTKHPNFVHGYNIAFANPGSEPFVPPDTNDFAVVAADHGLLMDESVRNWSHSNFSPGWIEPFYTAICREADYEKRIGGLPLFITFDMASQQDTTLNVLFGLAAGERYTYLTSPGDFAFGPLPKFLTRYSAFVWDDTKRLARPDSAISVQVEGKPSDAPWWKESVWLRDLPDNRQQILINLVNPPGYSNFASRVQTTPTTITDLTVRMTIPAGATLARAFHISPDLVEGHLLLKPVKDGAGMAVTLPRMRTWSIVGYEISGGPKPAFPLTTPVEDALAVLVKQAEEAAKRAEEQKARAGIGPSAAAADPKLPPYKDYAGSTNADLEAEKKVEKPKEPGIARNGVLDVHHARGAFSWLNPMESAAALAGAANYRPSWVDLVGFKLDEGGCMDEFPDTYDDLMNYDVLILDNVQALHLGAKRRVMIAAFVRSGGGLLVMGGYWNLSLGADRNTYIEDMLPVRIAGYKQIVQDNKGLPLKVEKADFFDRVDWSSPMQAFTVDLSPLKEDAEVLVTAGGKPALVSRPYGLGRVIAVLMNPHGDYGPDAKPYWLSSQWPRILASCIRRLGQGAEAKANVRKKRQADPKKVKPEDLAVEAFDLDSETFTARLKEARVNMVDADSARSLLETAVDHVDKIEDMELLAQIAEEARPYFDKSLAPLGEKLCRSDHDFIRQAGFQILGLAGDPKYRILLENALRDPSESIVREALIGLGRIGDPASLAPVQRYLKNGTQRLLALTVKLRLGEKAALREALPAYEQGLARRIRLKCGRGELINTLWGGVSFKLTPAARKRAMNDYRKQLRMEAAAQFDARYFDETIESPTDDELAILADFLIHTEKQDLLPLAYTVFSRLSPEKAGAFKASLAGAKLEALRLMAGN